MSNTSRYDGLVRSLMDELAADAAHVVIIGGERGTGSCPGLRLFPGEPEANQQLVTTLHRELVTAAEKLLVSYEGTKAEAATRGVIL